MRACAYHADMTQTNHNNTQVTPDTDNLIAGGWTNYVLLGLAFASTAWLIWPLVLPVTAKQMLWIQIIDSAVCLLFAIEFLAHWRQAGWGWHYLGRNWYAFIAMTPVAHPVIIANPWLSLLLVVARIGRAIDRILGKGFFFRLLARLKNAILQAISGVVTVVVLEEVADVLSKGTYTRNISRALQENQHELREMIMEKLREDPETRKLTRLPYYDSIVETIINAILRVTESTLNDPRTDELVADILRENIVQLRAAVQSSHENDALNRF